MNAAHRSQSIDNNHHIHGTLKLTTVLNERYSRLRIAHFYWRHLNGLLAPSSSGRTELSRYQARIC
jgi:hypothetical protein